MGYDELARSLSPQEAMEVDWRQLLRERLLVRDMNLSVMVSDAESQRRQEQAAQDAQEQKAQQTELLKAEVRKLLADAVKSLTQSDKNSAAADAAVFNTILGALEKNVSVDEVAKARAGGGVPSGIIQPKAGDGGTSAARSAH